MRSVKAAGDSRVEFIMVKDHSFTILYITDRIIKIFELRNFFGREGQAMVTVPVSWGELFDKITILEIKRQRIDDASKLVNIRRELDVLREVCGDAVRHGEELERLISELRAVNQSLWDIEDQIRCCERNKDFSERFIQLARSVYRTNDRRAEIKLKINRLLGSDLIEEKSYQAY